MSKLSTKEQIIYAADQLFYQQGFAHTSFAHISKVVNISRGNFYYHFKSKDQILEAVINARLAKTHKQLRQWDLVSTDSAIRIKLFIDTLRDDYHQLQLYGCPNATLCSELAKLEHISKDAVKLLFTALRTWLRRQFHLLGFKLLSDEHAIHILARIQGIMLMANVFSDVSSFEHEIAQLHYWLDTLIATKQHQSLGSL